MPRFLSSFSFLCLLLLAAACGKDEPEPEPTLEGTWHQQSHVTHYYDEAGQFIRDYSDDAFIARDAPSLVITDKTLTFRNKSFPDVSAAYTRDDNRLRYSFVDQSYITVTITELTSKKLTLHYVGPYRQVNSGVLPGHDEWDSYYTR